MQNEQSTLTGYPSIDKPWMKYYSEEAINKPLPNSTIYEYLWENNKNYLDSTALIYLNKKTSFKQMFHSIDNVARAFLHIGVKEGEVVAICMPSMPETIYSLYALNKIGAVPDLIDPRSNMSDLSFFLRESNAKVLVVVDSIIDKIQLDKENTVIENIITVSPVSSDIIYSEKTICIENEGKNIVHEKTWEKFISEGEYELLKIHNYLEKSLSVIIHTGGTTGRAKGIMLSNENINAIAHSYKHVMSYSRGDVLLDVIPPFASYGLCTSIHMPLSLGITVVLIPKFLIEDFGTLIIRYKSNYIVGVPSFLIGMLNDKKLKNIDLSFLKCVACGGDKLEKNNEEKLNDFLKLHGTDVPVIKGYGMSEMSSTAVTCTNTTTANKQNTVKRPKAQVAKISGVTVRTSTDGTAKVIKLPSGKKKITIPMVVKIDDVKYMIVSVGKKAFKGMKKMPLSVSIQNSMLI